MPVSLIPSFIYYCFVSGITPGPANLTSLSTALRHGKQTALRQWRGLFTGYFVVSLCSAVLLYFAGAALAEHIRSFSFVGAAYIVLLAIKILLDKGEETGGASEPAKEKKKFSNIFSEGTFMFGFLLQLTNVKIMVFCLTALSGFVLPYDARLGTLLTTACLLPFTGPICNLVWLFAGSKLQSVFRKYHRPINAAMALSLLACAVIMVI